MQEHRRQILNMLAEGKINAEQAERLLRAVDSGPVSNGVISGVDAGPGKLKARYLRVLVEAEEPAHKGGAPTTVNVRVPMQLLRAGVRLASLIPAQAHQHFDEAMSKHGVPLTLSQIRPENLEELVDHLEDLTVDIDAKESKAKVRVFCE